MLIENIQDVLGHTAPVITKTLYGDGSEKAQRAAADRWALCSRMLAIDVGVTWGSEPLCIALRQPQERSDDCD